MLNEILIGLNIASVFLLVISVIFILKMVRFENKDFRNFLSLIIIGLFLVLMVIVNDSLDSLKMFDFINNILIFDVSNIINLVIIPLAAICFLVAMFLFREVS